MTPANTEQMKSVPRFAKAGAACSIVPIARFLNEHIFALKGGGYGCLFTLAGVDEENMTEQELEAHCRLLEGALPGLAEGSCLYQYTRVWSGYELPRQKTYANPVTQVFVEDRLRFLEASARFRRIDLHWCLTIEPEKLKAFERKPQENAASTTRMQSLGSVKDIQSHLRHSRAHTMANEYMQELPESVQQMVGTVYSMLTTTAMQQQANAGLSR